jgi:hypothetical protein
VNEVVQELAVDKYGYEKEIKDMQKMFGNFDKCGGILFSDCIINRELRSTQREARIKNCAENCPRELPTHAQFLKVFITDIIIIINSDVGEVWRNQ